MTRREALAFGRRAPFSVRLPSEKGPIVYLSDYRKGPSSRSTVLPLDAEAFDRVEDAHDAAARARHLTSLPWQACCTDPLEATPCRCHAGREAIKSRPPVAAHAAVDVEPEPVLTEEDALINALSDAFDLDDEAELVAIVQDGQAMVKLSDGRLYHLPCPAPRYPQ